MSKRQYGYSSLLNNHFEKLIFGESNNEFLHTSGIISTVEKEVITTQNQTWKFSYVHMVDYVG